MAELRNKVVEMKSEEKPKFDPSKNYQWKPDAEFVLSGAEYDLLYKALRSNLQDPQFVAHVNQFKALEFLETVFIKGVESGVITEIEDPKPEQEEENMKVSED